MEQECANIPGKQNKQPEIDSLDQLIIKILDKARVSNKPKNGSYSKSQVKAIIAGMYEMVKEHSDKAKQLEYIETKYDETRDKLLEMYEIRDRR